MKKMMMLLVGLLVAAPFVFAQQEEPTPMETQLKTDIDMGAVLLHFEERIGSGQSYISTLQKECDNLPEEDKTDEDTLYRELVMRAITDPSVETDTYYFGRLMTLFYYLLGKQKIEPYKSVVDIDDVIQTVSEASLASYQEFYEGIDSRLDHVNLREYILPIMSMWKNRSYIGLVESTGFWENPQQAGKMYNTMAEIDSYGALRFIKNAMCTEDYQDDSTQIPQSKEEVENQKRFLEDFFAKFAKGGKLAAQDAQELKSYALENLRFQM